MTADMPVTTLTLDQGDVGIAATFKLAGLRSSTCDSFRMLRWGAVKIDGEKARIKALSISSGSDPIAQVGKRKFIRFRLV